MQLVKIVWTKLTLSELLQWSEAEVADVCCMALSKVFKWNSWKIDIENLSFNIFNFSWLIIRFGSFPFYNNEIVINIDERIARVKKFDSYSKFWQARSAPFGKWQRRSIENLDYEHN